MRMIVCDACGAQSPDATGRPAHFYASNEAAMADIRARAEEQRAELAEAGA